MVTPSGQAKILDFGVAKRLRTPPDEGSLTAEGAVLGTRRSMSPEQAQGQEVDERSDLFSLGVLLYEIYSGRPPFHGDGPTQTMLKVVAETPPVAHLHLSPSLASLIGQLLEKDPARRPASASEVVARLREIERVSDLTTVDMAPASGVTPRSWMPSRPRSLAALAVLVVLGGGALAALRLTRGAVPARLVAVLVTEPKVASAAPGRPSRFAAFAVRESILRALTRLEGIEVVEPEDLPENPLTVQEVVRAVAADEVVVPVIQCEGPSCRVSLRRQRGRDGRILGDSGPFEVSSEPEDVLTLSDAVAIHLRKTFVDHRPRAEGPTEVQSADYERYLSFLRRMDGGEVLTGRDVEELGQLRPVLPRPDRRPIPGRQHRPRAQGPSARGPHPPAGGCPRPR